MQIRAAIERKEDPPNDLQTAIKTEKWLSFFAPPRKTNASRVTTEGTIAKAMVKRNLGGQTFDDAIFQAPADKTTAEIAADFQAILKNAADVIKATIRADHILTNEQGSIHCIVVIEESHLAIHFDPKNSHLAIDVYTCGAKLDTNKAANYIKDKLGIKSKSQMKFIRGILVHESPLEPNLKDIVLGIASENQTDKTLYQFVEEPPITTKDTAKHCVMEVCWPEWKYTNTGKEMIKHFQEAFGVEEFDFSKIIEFHPQGLSVVCMLKDGTTITIHNWPEYNHVPVDIFFPKGSIYHPDVVMEKLVKHSEKYSSYTFARNTQQEELDLTPQQTTRGIANVR